jgi:hypothetical protein
VGTPTPSNERVVDSHGRLDVDRRDSTSSKGPDRSLIRNIHLPGTFGVYEREENEILRQTAIGLDRALNPKMYPLVTDLADKDTVGRRVSGI